MPSNLLLLLPLLGGYLFIHLCFRFHFRAQSLDGHRLIFESAVAGFILFLPCRGVSWLLFSRAPELREFWYELAGRVPLLSTLALTLLLAPCAAFVWNFFEGVRAWRRIQNPNKAFRFSHLPWIAREEALSRAVKKWGNVLQVMLHKATTQAAREEYAFVCLIMKDRKAFVGWVAKSPNLRANDLYVSLVPLMSGSRDKDTLDLTFSVFYPVERYFQADSPTADEFITILPVAEITSARLFDLELYFRMFADPDGLAREASRITLPAIA